MVDRQLCEKIICGAVSQMDAGMDTLLECSVAGWVGVKPCNHADCRQYEIPGCPTARQPVIAVVPEQPPSVFRPVVQPVTQLAMQSVYEQQPPPSIFEPPSIFDPVEQPLPTEKLQPLLAVEPQSLTPISIAPMFPTIVSRPPQPVTEQGPLCQFNGWVDAHPFLAVGILAAAFLSLGGTKQ